MEYSDSRISLKIFERNNERRMEGIVSVNKIRNGDALCWIDSEFFRTCGKKIVAIFFEIFLSKIKFRAQNLSIRKKKEKLKKNDILSSFRKLGKSRNKIESKKKRKSVSKVLKRIFQILLRKIIKEIKLEITNWKYVMRV